MGDERVIVVSAVVLRDDSGALLTVRKSGSHRFMLPGGKPESGESPRQTAVRECAEEIGVSLPPDSLTELGQFTAPAANEVGYTVRATIFEHSMTPVARPGGEIAEVRWVCIDPLDTTLALAPLLSEQVIPLLAARR